MPLPDIFFAHALNLSTKVGTITLGKLQQHFGSFEAAWRAEPSRYSACGLSEETCASLRALQCRISPEREQEKLKHLNIWLMDEADHCYPRLLHEIPQPPALLYGQGDRETLAAHLAIAIVGTRRPTRYGLEAATLFARDLAAAGMTVVSGLAAGIDAKAHEETLAVRGHTVAVLGSGLDARSLFPRAHTGLAKRIVASDGAIISEFPPGTPALKHHFPQRNRIVAGMAKGVLVVEARERSGALITARMGLETNREVFAVPGSIFSPTSVGPLLLCREGATPVLSAAHILAEFGISYQKNQTTPMETSLNQDEHKILSLLSEPATIDELATRSDFIISRVVSTLSLLELKGLVQNAGYDIFERAHRNAI